jgi:hypothetical protein
MKRRGKAPLPILLFVDSLFYGKNVIDYCVNRDLSLPLLNRKGIFSSPLVFAEMTPSRQAWEKIVGEGGNGMWRKLGTAAITAAFLAGPAPIAYANLFGHSTTSPTTKGSASSATVNPACKNKTSNSKLSMSGSSAACNNVTSGSGSSTKPGASSSSSKTKKPY